jgi:hypothetical protein
VSRGSGTDFDIGSDIDTGFGSDSDSDIDTGSDSDIGLGFDYRCCYCPYINLPFRCDAVA